MSAHVACTSNDRSGQTREQLREGWERLGGCSLAGFGSRSPANCRRVQDSLSLAQHLTPSGFGLQLQ
jgi:hypothetical protein